MMHLPHLDPLSTIFVALIVCVSVLATIFSIALFPKRERSNAGWSSRVAYFALLAAFCASMLLCVTSRDFIGIWIGISATTLATTFLVGFTGGKPALEAAWKYLILCSFGIAVALLGLLILGRAGMEAGLPPGDAVSWSALARFAPTLPPEMTRVALLLMMLGFAAKAGLVPMHAWLPDAHSKAPAPISALLSGLLVSCALYAIVRVGAVAALTIPQLFDGALLALGGMSVIVASLLMLAQPDLKRLFAYSTIEHSGLVAIALSIGTPLGLFAAIFHTMSHAIVKTGAFLAAGLVQHERGNTSIGALRGLFGSSGGKLLLCAIVALAGFPPFGLFFSEFLIVVAAVAARQWFALSLAGVGLILGFAALTRLAIETESGRAFVPGLPRTPRLAVAAASCLTVAAIALALVPYWRRF